MPRLRKPAALKLLEGNPGKRPIPVEPDPPAGEVVKPRGLSGRAAQIWEEKAQICIDMGTLTRGAEHQFAIWCRLAAKSETRFAKMTTAELAEFRRIGNELGLSQVGRAKLGKVPPKQPRTNPFGELAG